MKVLLTISALTLAGCASTKIEQSDISQVDVDRFKSYFNKQAKNTNIFKTNYLVERYTRSYEKAKFHKAFALSDSGAWAWKSDFIDLNLAIEGALGACELNNKNKQEEQPCQIINVDGHWAAAFFDTAEEAKN